MWSPLVVRRAMARRRSPGGAQADAAPELHAPITDPATLDRHRDLIDAMMMAVFPHAAEDETFGAAMAPFEAHAVYETPAFRRFDLLDHMRTQFLGTHIADLHVVAAYQNVLVSAYGREDVELHVAMPFVAPDPVTGLERHFNVTIEPHFLHVVAPGEKPTLTERQAQRLLADRMNLALWKEILPPEAFELHGFAVFNVVDVTEQQALALLTSDLLRTDGMAMTDMSDRLEARLRVLFQRPQLRLGLIALQRDDVDAITGGRAVGRSLLLDRGEAPYCPDRAQSCSRWGTA